MLKIIIVGFNEELNLKECFNSIIFLDKYIDYQIVFIDQSSTDSSVEIARSYTDRIYIHENLGYADPDKKWAINNCMNSGDWGLLLDADETITENLAKEIGIICNSKKTGSYNIGVKVFYLGDCNIKFNQLRLFTKDSVVVSDIVHNYIISKNLKDTPSLKYCIKNTNVKDKGQSIFNHIDKINRYSEKELDKYIQPKKIKVIIGILFKPIGTFLYWGIRYKLLWSGIPGFIVLCNMSYYTFIIYSKLYEKYFIKNS